MMLWIGNSECWAWGLFLLVLSTCILYWAIFSFVMVNRKYLEELCVWVESNTTTLNILSSHAEIGLGFLLIISLFSWVDWNLFVCCFFSHRYILFFSFITFLNFWMYICRWQRNIIQAFMYWQVQFLSLCSWSVIVSIMLNTTHPPIHTTHAQMHTSVHVRHALSRYH